MNTVRKNHGTKREMIMAVFHVVKTVTNTIVYEVEANDVDTVYETRDDWETPDNIVDNDVVYSEIDDVVRVDNQVDE